MNNMIFEVRTVANGVVVKVIDTDCLNEAQEIVYQETEDDEVNAFASFLWLLNDYYGPSTSRYSAKRIRITVEPGDKYADT